MEFIISNWYIILAVIAAVVTAAVVTWVRLPDDEKKAVWFWLRKHAFPKLTKWLKEAVQDAESYFKSGHGQEKLAMVHGWFCKKFPLLSKVMPFALFSRLVDDALDWMREQLSDANLAK